MTYTNAFVSFKRPPDPVEAAMLAQNALWVGFVGGHFAPESDRYRYARMRETENYLIIAGVL